MVYLERTKGVSSTLKRNEEFKLIRIGIVGSGRIAGRFVAEARYVSGIHVEGVFNPHIESAQKFALQHELDFYENNYETFLDKINAVYIASPHGTHYEYAKTALIHNKNVLLEKPMCMRKRDAEELFALSKENGCILMEAIKSA